MEAAVISRSVSRMKAQIIKELGQADILLPSLVAEGLAANDRIKVRLSALQAAQAHARQPDRPATELEVESRAAGIAPAAIVSLIRGAHLIGENRLSAPSLSKLMKEIQGDIDTMIRAVSAGAASEGERANTRLNSIRATGLLNASSEIELARIARLTGVGEEGGDSLHRLVMELHKALNKLAVDCSRIGFGERFYQALGRAAAIDFLKTALRLSTEALLAGQSVRMVRDQIEADLVRRLERVDSALLAMVLRQIGLAQDLVAAISRYVAARQSNHTRDGDRLATRASHIEQKADRIALEARREVARLNARPIIGQLIDRAEEAVDELEQAAFVASLAPAALDKSLVSALAELCGVAMTATEAAACGLASAAEVPEGRRADSEDALAAVVRLVDAQHAADSRERSITALVFAGGYDVATSLSVLELARAVERSTDRLAGFGHLLRRHIMIDLAA